MIPILFSATETVFATHGLGDLSEAISCVVVEERNGEYELAMEYPISGYCFSDIQVQRIILAKPNIYDNPQPFRIYDITRPLDGVVTINARHISYDLSGIVVALPYNSVSGIQVPYDITATSVGTAFAAMKTNSRGTNNFTFQSDIATTANFTIKAPNSFRSLMGGVEGSVLDVFGGEYFFDKFTVNLLAHRGSDRGFNIVYGHNLTDLSQEEEVANCYTGVMAFYNGEDGRKEGAVRSTGLSLGYSRIYLIDATEDFDALPSVSRLNEYADTYISSHELTAPKVSLSVSYQQVDSTIFERVSLCDTVHVYFELLGVDTTAKIIRTNYNVLLDRYNKVDIGSIRANIAQTLVEADKKIAKKITKSTMDAAINRATSLITGNRGGYVVTITDANGEPQELCIMDTPDINTATKVWRWNQNGLGYSSTGYNGDYGLAMTADGEIVADYISAGVLQSGDGQTFYLDLKDGILKMNNPTITLGTGANAKSLTTWTQQTDTNAEALEAISGYLNYSNGVVIIGDINSQIALRVENDRIAFKDTGTNKELAYFSNNELTVPDLIITQSMDFGRYHIDTTNGLSFKWGASS